MHAQGINCSSDPWMSASGAEMPETDPKFGNENRAEAVHPSSAPDEGSTSPMLSSSILRRETAGLGNAPQPGCPRPPAASRLISRGAGRVIHCHFQQCTVEKRVHY